MTVRELYAFLNRKIPSALSCDWDNDGLMCCPDGSREVKRVLVALDATGAVVDKAVSEGFDLILTHHPFIFKGIRAIEDESAVAAKAIELIKAGKKNTLARLVPHAGFAPENVKRLKDYIEDIAELILLTEDEGVMAILAGMIERKSRGEQLRDSGIPHLFIFGRYDYYIPVEVAEEMIAEDPNARVLWLEESGHMGFIEEPERCAEAILQLLQL